MVRVAVEVLIQVGTEIRDKKKASKLLISVSGRARHVLEVASSCWKGIPPMSSPDDCAVMLRTTYETTTTLFMDVCKRALL